MKIAIVAPHPVPLIIGGAEHLFWGLQRAIETAGHVCDIIGQISPERTLTEVIDSYQAFLHLDVSQYDCVITGKYPAWMINHPDHRVYMLHRLRGLYDQYPDPSGADTWLSQVTEIASLQRRMHDLRSARLGRQQISEFIARLSAALHTLNPQAVELSYPGPFARQIVHFLDAMALSPRYVSQFAAISRTVARRSGYFPPLIDPLVLPPPPHRNDYYCGNCDYFFTSSRLDRPKRLDLVIRAVQLLKEDIPLLIAGTGPDRARLEELAADDPRIQFLGFVPDEAMPALYANALAVPFVPFDEDYGLITLEAMRSGKPVVTALDSGGPCEFVRDGETGVVCDPNPEALSRALQKLINNRGLARFMGSAARDEIEGVTWSGVVEGLLGKRPQRRFKIRRERLVVATTFPVIPPQGGGRLRVLQLYRHLAHRFDVTIVSFGPHGTASWEEEIAPGLVESRVERSAEHAELEHRLHRTTGGQPIEDVALTLLAPLTPSYRNTLARAARGCRAVVACHPYLVREALAASPEARLWYEAQDVEINLKRASWANNPSLHRLLTEVESVERLCWQTAELVFGCTTGDLEDLKFLYGNRAGWIVEVPNGVDLGEVPFTGWEERCQQALAGTPPIALFIGSWHPPNIAAVEAIGTIASALPEVIFLVAGSVREAFVDLEFPANLRLIGQVESHFLNKLAAVAAVALNPMTFGSGSNLKLLHYFAAGIPVVTTPFGARGFDVVDEQHARIVALADFPAAIRGLLNDESRQRVMIEAGRKLVMSRYSWPTIAKKFLNWLDATVLCH
jgi:glycosyltransferase involved in cell wall biosynthesis